MTAVVGIIVCFKDTSVWLDEGCARYKFLLMRNNFGQMASALASLAYPTSLRVSRRHLDHLKGTYLGVTIVVVV